MPAAVLLAPAYVTGAGIQEQAFEGSLGRMMSDIIPEWR